MGQTDGVFWTKHKRSAHSRCLILIKLSVVLHVRVYHVLFLYCLEFSRTYIVLNFYHAEEI